MAVDAIKRTTDKSTPKIDKQMEIIKAEENKTLSKDNQKLRDECIKIITDYNIMFQDELHTFLPFTPKTFFNKGLHRLQSIKKALGDQKIKTKAMLKKKWYQSDNPTVQIALYKLIGSEDEYHRLSNTKFNVQGEIKEKISFSDFSKDEIRKIADKGMSK